MGLGSGLVAVLRHEVLMVMTASVAETHAPELHVLASGAIPLPTGAVILGPILDLRPHKIRFEEPVLLIFPVCLGATKAWRSSEEGSWEELGLADAQFRAGHAVLRLDHFCHVAVGTDGQPEAPLKISCFMNDSFHAKWAVTHAGCSRCKSIMHAAFQDEDILEDYKLCEEPFWAGVYEHMESLDLVWQNAPQHLHPAPGSVNFQRFPLVSPKKWTAPGHEVDLFVQDQREVRHCRFRDSVQQARVGASVRPVSMLRLYSHYSLASVTLVRVCATVDVCD